MTSSRAGDAFGKAPSLFGEYNALGGLCMSKPVPQVPLTIFPSETEYSIDIFTSCFALTCCHKKLTDVALLACSSVVSVSQWAICQA
jgi:hypothetical protein